ncbi:TPA: hypothetical protein KDX49_000015 [Vibrio parahaemolyticus]|nr:hypothetical protein [Vibrio parahaemolyticus]HBH7861120.1 hypothetical protein [Vibrio parahaemolyticus]HBH7900031.1 hypothetical protein [Vibrio parahaemolyticus]
MILAPFTSQRVIVSTPTIFDKKLIIESIKAELEPTRQDRQATPDMSWVIQMVSDELLEQILVHTRGNQAKASRLLGMNRGTYRSKINAIRERKLWID